MSEEVKRVTEEEIAEYLTKHREVKRDIGPLEGGLGKFGHRVPFVLAKGDVVKRWSVCNRIQYRELARDDKAFLRYCVEASLKSRGRWLPIDEAFKKRFDMEEYLKSRMYVGDPVFDKSVMAITDTINMTLRQMPDRLYHW